ncbi:winged helix-turn-helix domain-containing protein [Candidatus Halobonum tyrrellensis]|uniref:ArsR family transcriptional regulator n=1 Tax=Candidatus Halobonum tyrrellensis G22 TaxID=1324957 RepID=V4HPQ8_9EURY|nr:winged helix-turn-helix domain-containing protein [Candidatus Halobonum tyrrellensis]ESP89884.1 ArsR family transcriptional regulator [Candidatus Halobonum tyrrellensis G22]
MEGVLWYVLTGTRGGANRVRILRAIDDRPRNANRLADELDLDYTTVRHHLDVLCDNDVLAKQGDDYGAVYLPTDRARHHWETVEEIMEALE